MKLRCKLFGHDFEVVEPDPRPREYLTSGPRAGLPKLRIALAVCTRCGATNER